MTSPWRHEQPGQAPLKEQSLRATCPLTQQAGQCWTAWNQQLPDDHGHGRPRVRLGAETWPHGPTSHSCRIPGAEGGAPGGRPSTCSSLFKSVRALGVG